MTNSVAMVKDFLNAENDRDWTRWASFLHSNVQYLVVGEEEVIRGKDNYVKHMQQTYSELSDWQFRVLHIYGDEQAVMVEFDGEGYFTGKFQGKHYKHVPLHLTSVCIFELYDGLIYRVREYFDRTGWERQLTAKGNEY